LYPATIRIRRMASSRCQDNLYALSARMNYKHGEDRMSSRKLSFMLVVSILQWQQPLKAQTFNQLPDLGQNVGARLTRTVARQRLGVELFDVIATKLSYIDNGTLYQLA